MAVGAGVCLPSGETSAVRSLHKVYIPVADSGIVVVDLCFREAFCISTRASGTYYPHIRVSSG